MVPMNYEHILKSISKASGLTISEIEQRVDSKQKKISGLISKEGAAQIVAAELGVSFDKEKLKLKDLSQDMRGVNVVGKVIKVFPARTFTKNDKESKVMNLMLADETSNTKVVLWDTRHIEFFESGKLKEGSIVEIVNSSVRGSEIHLGSFSEIKPSEERIENEVTEKIFEEKKISDLHISNNANLRAFIVQIFDPKFFNVCANCKKKVTMQDDSFFCAEHGKVANEKRALMNVVLDDGTETIRAVLFHDNLPKLGLNDLENFENLNSQKQDLLGKEMVFSGSVRLNKFFNNPELIIEDVKETNIDNLISKLEK